MQRVDALGAAARAAVRNLPSQLPAGAMLQCAASQRTLRAASSAVSPPGASACGETDIDADDIEAIHRRAVSRGEDRYTDPLTGRMVFTQLFMLQRGTCCGAGCRHCPYGHERVTAKRRARALVPIEPPITC